MKDNLSKDGVFVKSLKLRNGQLLVNGQKYDTDNLHKLPPPVFVDKIFNGVTAFFRSYSALSNHHACTFQVNGTVYSSMEKCLMHTKAIIFDDNMSAESIVAEDGPDQAQTAGKEIQGLFFSYFFFIKPQSTYIHL